MLTISGARSFYLVCVLTLQLAAVSSVYGLPAHRRASFSHAARHGRNLRPALSQAHLGYDTQARHTYLRRRRAEMPLVSSCQRTVQTTDPHVHRIERRFLPGNITPVKHVAFAKRHHSKPEHDSDDDEGEEDEEDDKGHDAKGYDDGSWRGSNGNYGSKKGKGKGKDEHNDKAKDRDNDDDGGDSDSREARGKSHKQKDDEDDKSDNRKGRGNGSKGSKHKSGDEDEDAGSRNWDDEDDGNEDDGKKVFKPAGGVKAKSGKNAAEASEDDENESQKEDGPASAKKTRPSKSDESADEMSSGSSRSECDALAQIYEDMGGSEWIEKGGWEDLGEKCCSAYGVSCNDAGKISALDLPANSLTGALSSSIFDLAALTRLNLTGNAISGELPNKFDNLPHLSALYLDQNQISGQIPATLQNSSSISSIHLSNNTLDGMLYFPNAYNLTQLYASRNKFTYLNIDPNTALVKLVLDDNAFNCTLPDVQSFTDLQTFSVARNGFTGEIFDVTNLAKLVKLDVQHNQLTGAFPDITKLDGLRTLNLKGNDLSGHFPTGPAPSSLTTCYLDPVLTTSCPSSSVMKDPDSLAAQCQLKCRGGGKPVNAASPRDNDAEDGSGQGKGLPSRGRVGSAAGQEGSTVEGDDSGQTPASLAAAYTSAAPRAFHRPALVQVTLAITVLAALAL